MATFNVSWTIDNSVGSTGVRVRYRIKGTSIWSSFIADPSATTATFQADDNRIYDVQFQNINNDGNPLSVIVNDIGFSDPTPELSPTNTTLGYSFNNLSEDIDSYTVSVALFSTPGTYIATHYLSPAEPVVDQFTGLTPGTNYYLYITPVADQFAKTFTYIFTTSLTATCPAVQDVVATLS